MKYYQKIGYSGEEFAAKILTDGDYEVMMRNYRCKAGEIDIIAKKNNCYHFIEVKTRTSEEYGKPAEAVGAEKRRRIKRAAEYYISSHGLRNYYFQFDVIEVSVNMLMGCF